MQATDFDFFDAYSEGLKLLYMGKAPQAEGCFLAVVRAFHGLAAPGADARENAASASLQLGLINARLGSLAEALWHFERAEALGAKTPESTLKAAFCRFSLGLLEDPGADYQKILEQTPDEPEALIGAGRVAAARGEQDKALKLFGRAYEQGRKAEALVEKAMVLEAAGDAKGAAKALSEALGADPGLHERLLAEADKYLYLGLPRPARFFLRRAEKTAPGNPNLTYAIGYRYAAIGAVGDAERAYRSHLAATPTLMGFRELADLYEKTNRVDEAAETLRRPLENFPDDPRLNRLMALCQLRSGDAKGALARLEKVASAEADELTRAEVLNALGHARDRTGDSAGAWAAFAASKKFLKACQDYHAIDRSGIEGVVEGAKSLDPTALPKAPGQALPGGLKGLVFLVGFYRSGTTLVEQILAGHPDVVTAEERPILDAPMIVIDKLADMSPALEDDDPSHARLRQMHGRRDHRNDSRIHQQFFGLRGLLILPFQVLDELLQDLDDLSALFAGAHQTHEHGAEYVRKLLHRTGQVLAAFDGFHHPRDDLAKVSVLYRIPQIHQALHQWYA